ncbi:MAG TPA: toll/interleukin-1 receptor domain-containing protein [Polyangiaceae bacterium]|nr:toll/interleukin-1 receptor domain-containing protein [Polyangiaceae bacterium]
MASHALVSSARVFVSYSRRDVDALSTLERQLRREPVELIVDRGQVEAGADFISFMESALNRSDYCVLLWSKAARESTWVAEEWHAAYARCVRQKRSFLCVARLEPEEIPHLLASRVWVDLFPSMESGLDELANSLWRRDQRASQRTGLLVGAGRLSGDAIRIEGHPGDGWLEVYLVSEFLEIACPVRVSTAVPAAVLTRQLTQSLELPAALRLGGALIRVEYFLEVDGVKVPLTATLATVQLRDPPVVMLGVRILQPSMGKDSSDQSAWTYRSIQSDEPTSGVSADSLRVELLSNLRSKAVY